MENDEETLCRYGTPLPAFEEDAVPSKKPITVEDQIVLDSNGKRRFHGAFTGGFSAGYWNTVGSEEGWKPSEFKSSRREKALSRQQDPMDFMDEEDLSEFGIAPQRVQTRDDFAHSSGAGTAGISQKRRLDAAIPTGPIPGQPVLRALLEPAKEKTAVRMLKQMGWREGQGIGERQTRGEKKRANERNTKEQYVMKMYGCELLGHSMQSYKDADVSSSLSDSDDGSDYEITFAPDDFDPLVAAIKDNTFGLGYNGLDRGTAKGFNLFDTLEVVGRNNKKLSIRGQAFGIGALEDDDDVDVYARDDMSRYDFSLDDRQTKGKQLAIQSSQELNALEGFCTASKEKRIVKKVFRSTMPESFRPRNWLERRSRFDALDKDRTSSLQHESAHKIRGLGRHDLDPKKRAEILGEVSSVSLLSVKHQESSRRPSVTEQLPIAKDNCTQPTTSFPSGLIKEAKVLEQQYVGSTKEGFKPFIAIPDKQERYERFLIFQPTERYLTREQFLESLQPLNLSAWERERELKEFIQAERMYRPLAGLMSDRFVTASSLIAENTITTDGDVQSEIKIKRTRTMWKPHKDICKRFNVPEPFGGMMVDEENMEEKKRKEKAKFSVFDYLEAPVTNRRDFVTPVVIPAARATVEPRIDSYCTDQSLCVSKASVDIPKGQRLSSVDFFKATNDPEISTFAADSTSVPPKRFEKKKSKLEEQVLAAANKKPEEKRDLFKSIFCSSSSSSGDEEDQDDRQKEVPPKDKQPTALTDEEKLKLVDSFVEIKPASHVNILRNDSPPRGVFKSLFESRKALATPNSTEATIIIDEKAALTEDSSPSSIESGEDEQYYGPKLPQSSGAVVRTDNKGTSSAANERLQHLVGTVDGGRYAMSQVREEWVEKGEDTKGKKKKKHRDHHSKSRSKSSKHKKNKKKHSKKHSKNTKH